MSSFNSNAKELARDRPACFVTPMFTGRLKKFLTVSIRDGYFMLCIVSIVACSLVAHVALGHA